MSVRRDVEADASRRLLSKSALATPVVPAFVEVRVDRNVNRAALRITALKSALTTEIISRASKVSVGWDFYAHAAPPRFAIAALAFPTRPVTRIDGVRVQWDRNLNAGVARFPESSGATPALVSVVRHIGVWRRNDFHTDRVALEVAAIAAPG
jgi:hypothetical protein